MNRPGMAIAEVLNAPATTRTSVRTVERVQGTGCELLLLHSKTTPEQLRIVSPTYPPVQSAGRGSGPAGHPGYPARIIVSGPGPPRRSKNWLKAGIDAGERPVDPCRAGRSRLAVSRLCSLFAVRCVDSRSRHGRPSGPCPNACP